MTMSESWQHQRCGQSSKSGHSVLRASVAAVPEIMGAALILRSSTAMLLTRLLNACHHFPGFVYSGAHLMRPARPSRSRSGRGSVPRAAARAAEPAPGLRSTALAPLRIHSGVGLRGRTALPHAPRAVRQLRRQSGAGALGGGQTHPDPRLHAAFGALGTQALVAGDRAELSHQLGEGLPRCRVRRAVGARAPGTRLRSRPSASTKLPTAAATSI